MADNKQKTFKVSELKDIDTLDGEDLFLVSDYDNGECHTRKLSFDKLMTVLTQDEKLVKYILDRSETLDKEIAKKVDEKVDEGFNTINGGNAFDIA